MAIVMGFEHIIIWGNLLWPHLLEYRVYIMHTVYPRLDALHALDVSAHFDNGSSGRNTF